MDTPGFEELLKHFDAELAQRLAGEVGAGRLQPEHIAELVKLTAALPEYREAERFESLLEDAEEMDAPAFKLWVEHCLEEARDG